jgi:hypothetical protein
MPLICENGNLKLQPGEYSINNWFKFKMIDWLIDWLIGWLIDLVYEIDNDDEKQKYCQ